MTTPIYMDSHATTRVDPRVVEAMLPFFEEHYGNAASRHHRFGWIARDAVTEARAAVATLIGAPSRAVVFTSGASESNNLALKGIADQSRDRGNHLVTVQTEHRAVLDPLRRLEQQGFQVSCVPVRSDGIVDLSRLDAALTPATVLVSVMMANNEIGVLQPIAELTRNLRARHIPFHTDAAQAAGHVPIDVQADGIDLLSLTAHKLYGPKGIGALYVRPGLEVTPLLDGGGHEYGLRSGTLNVPGIVGFGRAATLCCHAMHDDAIRLASLRDRLLNELRQVIPDLQVNGSMAARLPHNLNISVPGLPGEQLLMGLEGVAVSSGAACSSGTREPSHVLRALGVPERLAEASLRFGLGRFNTDAEVDAVVEQVGSLVARLRAPVPVFEVEENDDDVPPEWQMDL